jgi:predicted lipoprotein with Yx(FWY)xxD motif
MNRLTVALMSTVAMLATAAVAFASSAHTSAATTVVTTHHTKYGTILVTGSGRTLYLDVGDKPPHFACTGGCLAAWPPLKAVGKVTAKGAAKAALLGTVKGPGGKMVTYKGHPLYTWMSDTAPGQVTGEGVNGFYVVNANGSKVTKAQNTSSSTTTSSSTSSGGYGY